MKTIEFLLPNRNSTLRRFPIWESQGAELSKINRKYDKRICCFSMNNLKTADR
ncbi:MAG: hypothetical protein OXI43_15535 [Candidatus Poribacteria bacterium]|nr:hypothetical protein [Candidatus Poribacteria bacterium]